MYIIFHFLRDEILYVCVLCECFRYGPLFRTSILGVNTVISTDMDVNLDILRHENEYFNLSYPDGLVKPLGKESMFLKTGNIHKHIKKICMRLLGSENLKRKIIKDMDHVTCEHLNLKAGQRRVDLRDLVSSVIFLSFFILFVVFYKF